MYLCVVIKRKNNMGCFNRIGFHSKLPITYGDKIVLFICESSGKTRERTSFPIYFNDDLNPLFLPLIGEYDDYGGIENYDKNVAENIENILGVKLDDLIPSILRLDGFVSLKDISELENSEDESVRSHYQFDKKEYDCYKTALTNLHKHRKWTDMSSYGISITMERYDVYKKMSSLLDSKESFDVFNKMVELKEKHNLKFNILNPKDSVMSIGERLMYSESKDKPSDEIEDLRYIVNEVLCRFSNDSYGLCYPYNVGDNIDVKLLSTQIYDFILFNRQLTFMNGFYSLSSYGNQDVWYAHNSFKVMNDLYAEIIEKETKKYEDDNF